MTEPAVAGPAVPLTPAVVCQLAGEDRQSWLQNFCTADLKQRTPGTACEAFILNVRGRTLAHVIVLVGEVSIYLLAIGSPSASLVDHLDRYVIREDVQIADQSAQCQLAWFGGPQPPVPGIPEDGLKPWAHIPLDPHRLLIASSITSGRDWLLLTINGTTGGEAERTTTDPAQSGDRQRFEQGRIAARWPLNGTDLTDANFPQEFRRDQQAISFTKGCYLGQETVARIDALGHVNQFLVKLSVTGDWQQMPGSELRIAGDDKPVGRITSAVSSDSGSALALGFVRRTKIDPQAVYSWSGGQARLLDEQV